MRISWITAAIIIYMMTPCVRCQITSLDSGLLQILRKARQFLFTYMEDTTNPQQHLKRNIAEQTVQVQLSENEKFFCDTKAAGRRSDQVPNSVHQLRPGDIDIVGSIGDSLTAGHGVLATNVLEVLSENRGAQFTIGGMGTWRQFLTLPNILKEFNPNLYGYTEKNSLSFQRASKFNVAEGGAMSRDTPHQARNLVLRMKNDPQVDMEKHWKFVTYFIGGNDFCLDMCYDDPMNTVRNHEKELLEVLRTLRDNLPRTFVSIILAPTIRSLVETKGEPQECITTRYFECPCFYSLHNIPLRRKFYKVMEAFKKKQWEISNMEEFHNKDDFAVTIQPFTDKIFIPRKANGLSDFSYMSKDCFHLSQKAQARAANAYWNNILEPYGNKTNTWKEFLQEFKCPTEERPFLATRFN
ncbi:Phospholipase B [Sergentomyia squamirostris]